ncbi:MAG: hypothetical protein NMNS02_25290 [Nitrosomonas sp.]|nr:MAG: hypothetical protein NMNS02_25290 [Nitrosomonas sp.]
MIPRPIKPIFAIIFVKIQPGKALIDCYVLLFSIRIIAIVVCISASVLRYKKKASTLNRNNYSNKYK